MMTHLDRRYAARGVLRLRDGILAVRPRGSNDWILPGGGVDDADAEGAVVREVREETGVEVRVVREVLEVSEPGRCAACVSMRRVILENPRYPFMPNDHRAAGGCHRRYYLLEATSDMVSPTCLDSLELEAVGMVAAAQLTCPLDRAAAHLAIG